MSSRRLLVAGFAMMVLVVGGAASKTLAQDASPLKPVAAGPAPVATPYRLDFLLTETDGGKKIDSRRYTLTLSPPGQGQAVRQGRLQIGTRVPIGTKTDGTTEYLDAGTSIDTYLMFHDGIVTMHANCQVTSVAQEQPNANRPVFRTLTISNDVAVIENKPMLVGTVDDPNSNREFQLEVTVTELK